MATPKKNNAPAGLQTPHAIVEDIKQLRDKLELLYIKDLAKLESGFEKLQKKVDKLSAKKATAIAKLQAIKDKLKVKATAAAKAHQQRAKAALSTIHDDIAAVKAEMAYAKDAIKALKLHQRKAMAESKLLAKFEKEWHALTSPKKKVKKASKKSVKKAATKTTKSASTAPSAAANDASQGASSDV